MSSFCPCLAPFSALGCLLSPSWNCVFQLWSRDPRYGDREKSSHPRVTLLGNYKREKDVLGDVDVFMQYVFGMLFIFMVDYLYIV